LSKKAKKAKKAEAVVQVKVPEPVPVPAPKPLGRKATLIAAKRAKLAKRSERRVFTRERTEARTESANTPTAWAERPAAQSVTRAHVGRLLTAQIAPLYKPTIGQPSNSLDA